MMLRPMALLLLLAAPANTQAAAPLADLPPLVTTAAPSAPGDALLKLNAARSALAQGLPSVAAELLEQILALPATLGADRNALVLDLVSARLDTGDPAAAAKALAGFTGAPTAASQLREGLIAVGLRHAGDARQVLAVIRPDELTAPDRAWYDFLKGALAEAGNDLAAARGAYQQAMDAAGSDLQRAQFTLARDRSQLGLGQVTEAQAAEIKANADRYQGRPAGYDSAREYAVAEARLGHKGEAVAYLQLQLQGLPAAERATSDDFRLLLGLIEGPEGAAPGGAGRNALEGLLTDAASPELQRAALQLLALWSENGPARAELHDVLGKLIKDTPSLPLLTPPITLPPRHPILEDLLLFRAKLLLEEKQYMEAEADAKKLLESFPGSQLKPEALGLLTAVAWEQRRYRTAADDAAQTRAALPPGDPRAAPLRVLVAEAYFRAEDFQSAAEAYDVALHAPPVGVSPGSLIFQQVLSELKAGGADPANAVAFSTTAARILDGYAGNAQLDPVNRWSAEWNLALTLQASGHLAEARTRVDRLLGGGISPASAASTLPAGLRVRMAWLQAWLALHAGTEALASPATTSRAAASLTEALTRSQTLLRTLAGETALEGNLKQEVASNTLLLQAEAEFKLGHEPDAVGTLKQLRTDFPTADAAVHSYIDEADDLEGKNDFVDAQVQLTKLADTFKDHPYAPFARYRAALDAERRGDKYYDEAKDILKVLLHDYPQSDIAFYARLKQGDLLRRGNQFGEAQQIYEYLVHNYPQHLDEPVAELALADCHRAQAATDPSHYESALAILTSLQDRSSAPADLRVEAGFQHGDLLLAQPGDAAKAMAGAEAVWLTLVTTYLPEQGPQPKLGANGRAWLARALLHLGDLLAQDHHREEALNAYSRLISQGLPFQELAQTKLTSLKQADTPPPATK